MSHENELLGWASRRKDLFQNIEERVFDLPYGRVYSFSVHGKSLRLGRKFIGVGRDLSRTKAASKAIGEAVERIVAAEMLSETNVALSHPVQVSKNEGISISEFANYRALPPTGIHSSNGWAVHFDKATAIESAVRESLERHILLRTYLREGWDGFKFVPAPSFNNFRFGSLFSVQEVAGYRAGIAVSEMNSLPGFAMGYCCDRGVHFQTSQRWLQGFFESYETALYYKGHPGEKNAWASDFNYELLAEYQEYYLNHPTPKWNIAESHDEYRVETASIKANLVVLDLSQRFDIHFPFYAAFIFGSDLIPLFFNQRLCEEEKIFIRNILKIQGISGDIPEYHPIV